MNEHVVSVHDNDISKSNTTTEMTEIPPTPDGGIPQNGTKTPTSYLASTAELLQWKSAFVEITCNLL